jgi:hypothetical protein
MLAQISSSTLDALPKELEPSSLVLDDGVDATSLIGAEVRRKFPSGWFNGRVVQVFPDPNYPDVLLFKVVYEDNDDEVMTYESLTKILVNAPFQQHHMLQQTQHLLRIRRFKGLISLRHSLHLVNLMHSCTTQTFWSRL